jgi:hypothetical protein
MDPLSMVWDSSAKKRNLIDARRVFHIRRDIPIDEARALCPGDRSLTSRLRDVFGLEPGLSPILGMLMKRTFVSHSSLYTVLYAGRPEYDWPDAKVMDVQICKLRRKLRKHGVAIQTRWGEGWGMSMSDKAKVRAILDRFSSQPLSLECRLGN